MVIIFGIIKLELINSVRRWATVMVSYQAKAKENLIQWILLNLDNVTPTMHGYNVAGVVMITVLAENAQMMLA